MANSRICSIDGCDNAQSFKGYCRAHYQRLRRHGDPRGGGTSPGERMRFIHEVALHHTGGGCLTWPFSKNSKGYGRAWVDGKNILASRYVCELVHGAPPTPEHEAAHSCGKGHEACIAPGHLEWKTHAQNMADTLAHGTSNRGDRNGQVKLTEADVRDILAMKGKETQQKIAERFLVSRSLICRIHTGRNWAWLAPA